MQSYCHARTRVRTLTVGLALGLLSVGLAPAQAADDKLEAEQLVERARLVIDTFAAEPKHGTFRENVKKAKALLVVPESLRGAFIFGAQGGNGVVLARDAKTGRWLGPTFVTLGGANAGLQAGADTSEVIFVAMTDRGMTKLLSGTFKLGADASVAAGPLSLGVGGATAETSADILVYGNSKGLYAGFSLDTSVIAVRDSLNHTFYGTDVFRSPMFWCAAPRKIRRPSRCGRR
jgi:lipid-binding SYLF domain-containing protein